GFGADLPAGKAAKLISAEIQTQGTTSTGSSFTLIFSSAGLTANDDGFRSALVDAVAPLGGDSRVTAVRTPYNVPDTERSAFISKDSHKALVVVELKDNSPKA